MIVTGAYYAYLRLSDKSLLGRHLIEDSHDPMS